MSSVRRVVALGASNLTRGLHTVVATAREAWGPEVEVLAALGHGRSYGAPSRILARTLPGILECGLWRALDARPEPRTRALVTDVGNDILYGYSAEQTLAWVDEALHRLEGHTHDVVVTDLPLHSIRRLSRARFLLFRSLLVPSCRLSLAQVLERAEAVHAGLAELAAAHGLALFRLKAEWYGLDPIHIRPGLWRSAWQQILGAGAPGARRSAREGLKLYAMAPERQWLFGTERLKPQSGVALRSGGRVFLY
jgi:hypothetical protein